MCFCVPVSTIVQSYQTWLFIYCHVCFVGFVIRIIKLHFLNQPISKGFFQRLGEESYEDKFLKGQVFTLYLRELTFAFQGQFENGNTSSFFLSKFADFYQPIDERIELF